MNQGRDCENLITFDFSEESIRKGFFRKVYSILMCQLLVTMVFIVLFLYHQPTKSWAFENPWLMGVAFATIIVCVVVMACCSTVRRSFPMNFIFLAIFTLAESFLIGVVSTIYEADMVLMAVGITAAVCLVLTLFALQSEWDFTTMRGISLAALLTLFVFGIAAIFMRNRLFDLLYASLGALLFSCYLVHHTQLMMGGEHKYSVSPEDYIFAALNLYLVIINLSLYILAIIARR